MMDSIDFTTLDLPQNIPGEISALRKGNNRFRSMIFVLIGLLIISAIVFLIIYLSNANRRGVGEIEPEPIGQ